MSVMPGSVISALIVYRNDTEEVMHDATIRMEMPDCIQVVPRSIAWTTNSQPRVEQRDDVFGAGGLNVGNYALLSAGEVSGTLRMRLLVERSCGDKPAISLVAFLRWREHPDEVRSLATLVIDR